MIRLMFHSLLLAGLFLSTLQAQEVKDGGKKEAIKEESKKEPAPTKEAPAKAGRADIKPGDVEVLFFNGSKVRLHIQSAKLDIATIYGQLSVPIQDVKAIEFGLRFPEDVLAKLDRAVKNIGSGDYREREKAAKTLIELGPYAYPAVLKESQSKSAEVAARSKEILQKLRAKHSKNDLKTTVDDKVVTPSQTIVGRILTATVKAQADYFGNVDLKLANMRSLRAIAAPGQEVEVTIDAAKYAVQGQWMDTNYEVNRTALSITAKGQIDTWPQQPGQWMCGPGGVQAGGGGGPGGIVFNGGGGIQPGRQRIVAGMNMQALGGALLGKIGADGEIFLIGERYEGAPDAEGKLYLHIGPSPWNCASTGIYTVKIAAKSD